MSKSLEELQREYEENTVKLEQEKRLRLRYRFCNCFPKRS